MTQIQTSLPLFLRKKPYLMASLKLNSDSTHLPNRTQAGPISQLYTQLSYPWSSVFPFLSPYKILWARTESLPHQLCFPRLSSIGAASNSSSMFFILIFSLPPLIHLFTILIQQCSFSRSSNTHSVNTLFLNPPTFSAVYHSGSLPTIICFSLPSPQLAFREEVMK